MNNTRTTQDVSGREEKSDGTASSGAEPSTNATTPNNIQVTHRTNRSAFMFILHLILRPLGPTLTNIKCELPAGSPRLDIPKSARRRVNVKERHVNDMWVYDCTPKNNVTLSPDREKTKHKRIYYFAGGGWRMPASADHWAFCSHLAANLPNTTLSLISYPLAPNNPAPNTIPKLLNFLPAMFEASVNANETIILAGDSAGANLALALPLEMLRTYLERKEQYQQQQLEHEGQQQHSNQHQPESPAYQDHEQHKHDLTPPTRPLMPDHILTVGPSVDLRRSNPEIPIIEKRDPLLRHKFIKATSDVWRHDWPAEDPRCSPLLCSPEVLRELRDAGTQVHGVTGGYDILTPDGLLFRERLEKAGIKGDWLHWEKQMHVFPLAYRWGLPESREGKNWILEKLKGAV